MSAELFIGLLIGAIFAVELIRRWWRENEWKRRWRKQRRDED